MYQSPSTLLHLSDVEGALSSWRERLREERRFRTGQLAQLNHEIESNPRLVHDEVTMALRSAATAVLSEVNEALSRMDAGRYGRCTRCTQPIPAERLDVLPMAALCMPCQYDQQGARR